MELFYAKFSATALKGLMASINKARIRCRCDACRETFRWDGEPPSSQRDAFSCRFVGFWEDVLGKYRITFEYRPTPEDEPPLAPEHFHPVMGARIADAPSALVNVGPDNLWREVALGAPATRNDNDPFSPIRARIRLLFGCVSRLSFQRGPSDPKRRFLKDARAPPDADA